MRRDTSGATDRGLAPAVGAALLPFVLAGTAAGQEADTPPPAGPERGRIAVEIRGGVALSSPFLEGDVASFQGTGTVVEEVTAGPDPGPWAGVSLLWAVEPPVEIELAGSLTRASLAADGAVDSWDAGDVTVLAGTVGFRYHFFERFRLGGSVGVITQSGSDLPWLADDGSHLLISGTLGVHPVDRIPVEVEVIGQGHSMGGPVLRRAGGLDGDVGRILVGVSWVPWETGR